MAALLKFCLLNVSTGTMMSHVRWLTETGCSGLLWNQAAFEAIEKETQSNSADGGKAPSENAKVAHTCLLEPLDSTTIVLAV